MSVIGQAESATQNRVIALFRDELSYAYLGDWSERADSNVEEELLTAYLAKSGYSAAKNDFANAEEVTLHGNLRFIALMDQFMPKWKFYKEQLIRLPVRHEDWGY